MGRFDGKFDDEVRKREAELDERDRTKHVENDAALPLYERVMPILERARRELESRDITVDFSPELSLPNHLRFQLICNKNGAGSSVYRFSLSAKHGPLRAHKCEPSDAREGDKELFRTTLVNATDAEIEGVVDLAIEEIAPLCPKLRSG